MPGALLFSILLAILLTSAREMGAVSSWVAGDVGSFSYNIENSSSRWRCLFLVHCFVSLLTQVLISSRSRMMLSSWIILSVVIYFLCLSSILSMMVPHCLLDANDISLDLMASMMA